MKCAFVHQVPADLGSNAGLEQHVIRQDYGCPASGFQGPVHMLEKGELLVAGGVGEIVPGGTAAAPGSSKGRICQDQIGLGQAFSWFTQGVSQSDYAFFFAFHAVEQAVHQSQTPGSGNEFHSHIGLVYLKSPVFVFQVKQIIGLGFDVGIGRDQKSGRACCRVLDDFTGLGFNAADDAVYQGARGEILACAGFGFADVFLQKPFVEIAQAVFFRAEPVYGVDAFDELLQMPGFPEASLGVCVYGGDQGIVGLAQIQKHLTVIIQKNQP